MIFAELWRKTHETQSLVIRSALDQKDFIVRVFVDNGLIKIDWPGARDWIIASPGQSLGVVVKQEWPP